MMHRNRSVNVNKFAMVPRPDVPRSSFNMQRVLKTTFDAGFLIPVLCEEVLPGDTFKCRMTAFARLQTPIVPVMDNLHLESFFFFCPNRLVWENWVRFMGEQPNPGDSISFLVPQMTSPAGGYSEASLQQYFGLPRAGQVAVGETYDHSVLPLRMYNLIWNEWFRDQNLQNAVTVRKTDSGDLAADFALLRRGKRHDYFTSALPWPQKGAAVGIPLAGQAPIVPSATDVTLSVRPPMRFRDANTGNASPFGFGLGTFTAGAVGSTTTAVTLSGSGVYPTNLYADLSLATGATINQLRQAFQIQRLLERDARGGTRYTERVQAHFGVRNPDARLQRPEYLGGGHTPIVVNPVAQTSATGVTGGSAPLGTLGAIGTAVAQHGFTQSFTEHGYVIGLVSVRADLTYQQGLRRHWSRRTMYDYYFPAFAMLGEQAVLNKEIYCDGTAADEDVFGYQERWAELRYMHSEVTGAFNSRRSSGLPLDFWHMAQNFVSRPTLGSTFIQDQPPLARMLAAPSITNSQLLMDTFFQVQAARPLPMYSVPGMADHF